jgi:two-component system CheB/CheR fusion protein
MTISDGILHRTPPTDPRGSRMTIDRFLLSLAKDRQNQAIAIISSGSGTDGTLGIREIRANGGLVMVQDPDTAEYDGMPRSAIATGQADAVLPLERVPEVLTGYLRHPYIQPEVQSPTSLEAAQGPLNAILSLLLTKTGHDFRCYKISSKTRARSG